jgi:ribA/ribD-fused uncharacterized protein
MSGTGSSDSVVTVPVFPRPWTAATSGPREGLSVVLGGQLLLLNDKQRWTKEALDLPNITRIIYFRGFPAGETQEGVTKCMVAQLLECLDEIPEDTTLPHVALLWEECPGSNVHGALCNVLALALAKVFRLRNWEARDLVRVELEKHVPGTWTTSANDEQLYAAAYREVAFPDHNPAILLFYAHDPKYAPYHVFSQFFKISYVGADGKTIYGCSEQEMHAEKALLFGDHETHQKIMRAKSPYDHKKFGRLVRGFDKDVWEKHCFAIVARANVAKFSNSTPAMRDVLMSTGDSEIYEATASDTIWAIGLDVDVAEVTPKHKWLGMNLLGKALVYARNALKAATVAASD